MNTNAGKSEKYLQANKSFLWFNGFDVACRKRNSELRQDLKFFSILGSVWSGA